MWPRCHIPPASCHIRIRLCLAQLIREGQNEVNKPETNRKKCWCLEAHAHFRRYILHKSIFDKGSEYGLMDMIGDSLDWNLAIRREQAEDGQGKLHLLWAQKKGVELNKSGEHREFAEIAIMQKRTPQHSASRGIKFMIEFDGL
eukprot:TRINITY_DN11345_c0_g1::TRINITY_DN11345_c0_g1_i1::g.26430::m.26430 TRINITY_DN11345_c0_g1::TRINITY_DN11345_c0_g1_i1::g.26430  ORF type:complete len:144 (-),score=-7.19,Mhr1/PF12829.2/0.13 TRINITY_DN11345_c0_g1_i1:714-1145(-)